MGRNPLSCSIIGVIVLAFVSVACSGTGKSVPAPVVDKTPYKADRMNRSTISTPSTQYLQSSKTDPVHAKPGFYIVKPGDTLIKIGLEHGQNWRDIIRWNNIENPNLIEVGQSLRVFPSVTDMTQGSLAKLPLTKSTEVTLPNFSTPSPSVMQMNTEGVDDGLVFSWPAIGPLLSTFEEGKSKGIDISGRAGDPVMSAADGRVIYAGSGLRGYGNLIIIKHNSLYLTAYAHNQSLSVKEEQLVRKGQKIAEMGNSESDTTKLHFQIRRMGKAVDPTKYLSALNKPLTQSR